MTTTTQTVREIALAQPSSIRVFEHYGIDFCCGGRRPLDEACTAGNVEIDAVLAALEAAAQTPAAMTEDWQKTSLEALCNHIVLAVKVVRKHGDTQVELQMIQSLLAQLDAELTQHLGKEEAILFPYVVAMERAIAVDAARPHGCFETVSSPISMMLSEHDAAGALLAKIRTLSHQFTTPTGACPTYHAFFDGLHEFEQDLHQHIHLENNILFPRAIQMESAA